MLACKLEVELNMNTKKNYSPKVDCLVDQIKYIFRFLLSCKVLNMQAFVGKACDRTRTPTAFEECKISHSSFYSESEILYQ